MNVRPPLSAAPSLPRVALVSLVLHALVAVALWRMPKRAEKVSVVVTLRSAPKPAAPAPEVVPIAAPLAKPVPTPIAKPPAHRAPSAAPTARSAPPASAPTRAAPKSSAPADFGLSLSGGGGGSMAVPAGSPGGGGEPAAKHAKPVAASEGDACPEPPTKAKALEVPQPVYPESEREAATAGKVRIEIELDATGAVVSARVLQSLSPAFDAAALEAAKQARFQPATTCGKPAATKFTMSIRFEL